MTDESAGVAIGHYNNIDFLRLNIAAIRHHCGAVPILVCDDCSQGFGRTPRASSSFGRVMALTEEFDDVVVWPNVERIGHAGGDMSALWKGIIWAKCRNLGFFAKLSQRFIIDEPRWLQDGVAALRESGLPALGRSCTAFNWRIRTEGMILNTVAWHRPDVLAHLTPRRIAWPTECVVWDDIRDRLGGRILNWEIVGESRLERVDSVLFCHANEPGDYQALASRLGLTIPVERFPCGPTEHSPDYMSG